MKSKERIPFASAMGVVKEDFKERLRELVIYTLPRECRDDEDIVELLSNFPFCV